jgi:hypothetical protein
MSVKAGRKLLREEETDHIDGDRTHDEFSNLQIITKSENSIKAATDPLRIRSKFKMLRFTCLHCGKVFEKERKRSHLANGKHATYCTRECGVYSRRYDKIPQVFEWIMPPIFTPSNKGEPWDAWTDSVPLEFMKHIRITKIKYKTCEVCSKPFRGRRRGDHRFCSPECSQKARARNVPNKQKMTGLYEEVKARRKSWASIGRDYGVSDNAARKWAKKYGLLK